MRPLFLILALGCCAAVNGYKLTLTGSELPGGVNYFDNLYEDKGMNFISSVLLLDDFDVNDLAGADSVVFPDKETFKFTGEPFKQSNYTTYILKQEGKDSEVELTVDMAQKLVDGRVEDADGNVFIVQELPADLAEQAGVDDEGASGPRHVWLTTTGAVGLEEESEEVPDPLSGAGALDYNYYYPLSTSSQPYDTFDYTFMPSSNDFGNYDVYNYEDNSGMVTISIKVYYTAKYKADTTNVMGKIENMIAKTNQGYLQSGTGVKLDLICVEEYTAPEIRNSQQMVEAFGQYKGDVPSLLGSADIAVLMTSHNLDIGGRAAAIGDRNKPYAVVEKIMGEDYYNFGHEVSHLLGAWHDSRTLEKQNALGSVTPSYALANTLPNGKFTITGYSGDSPNTRESMKRAINFYSGPNTYDDEGNVTGDAYSADNVRVIRENRAKFASIGDESQRCF